MCSARLLVTSLLLTLCSLASPTTFAQTAPFDAFPDLWVADNTVRSLDVVGDTLYIGGDFDYVGPPTGQLAVLNKTTGEPDLRLPRVGGAGSVTAIIQAVVPDGQGGYYVGGDLRFVSGEERYNLAHVLADGTLDPDFRPDPILDTDPFPTGAVSALALDSGVLYVGGQFDRVGGQPRMALAALDAETGAVLPLNANIFLEIVFPDPFREPSVSEVFVRDGVVYIGGDFTHVAGQPRPNAVALDGVTGALLPWGASPNDTAVPVALADSTLYLYGGFSAVNGQSREVLAEVTLYDAATGGGAVTAWQPEEPVYGFDFVLTRTDLWAASYVSPILRRVDRETGAVEAISVEAGLRFGRGIALDPVGGPSGEGTLYLACNRLIGTRGFPVVVGVDPATGQATGYEVLGAPGYLGTDYVGTVAVEPGPAGRVFAGGTAVSLGGVRRGGLAALDLTTGRALPPFNGEIGPSILDVAASPDGHTVYYGSLGSLGVLDVPTWSLREFGGTSATPTSRRSAQAAPAGAGAAPPPHRTPTAQPPGVAPPPAASAAGGTPRLLGNNSAFVVTEDVLYDCVSGCVAYDRQTEGVRWVTPAITLIMRETRALLLDGPGGPGGTAGTLYLSGAIEEIPIGQPRAAFAALDPAAGEVFDWDVGVTLAGPGGSLGGGIAWLDADGEGPGEPVLYLGGDQLYEVQGEERETDLLAVEPETAVLLPWDPGSFLTERYGALAMAAHRAAGGGGVVYTNNGLALDAATAEPLAWEPDVIGGTVVLSERHEALFFGGFFRNSLRGSGHAGLVAVTPAAPILPTSGEPSGPEAPTAGSLALAGPNPFAGSTALTLTLPEAQHVEAALYDVLGRRVAVLHEGPLTAGTHQIEVSASTLPAGVYVVRVTVTSFTASQALTLVR